MIEREYEVNGKKIKVYIDVIEDSEPSVAFYVHNDDITPYVTDYGFAFAIKLRDIQDAVIKAIAKDLPIRE